MRRIIDPHTYLSLALIALLALVAAPLALADEDDIVNPEEQMQAMMAKMAAAKDVLGLTDEQAAQVKEILQDNARQMKEVFAKHGLEPGDKPENTRAKVKLGRDLKPIREQGDKKLAEVLNEDQMKAFKQMREDAKNERKNEG